MSKDEILEIINQFNIYQAKNPRSLRTTLKESNTLVNFIEATPRSFRTLVLENKEIRNCLIKLMRLTFDYGYWRGKTTPEDTSVPRAFQYMQDIEVLSEFMQASMPLTFTKLMLGNHDALTQYTKLQNDCLNFGIEKGKSARA